MTYCRVLRSRYPRPCPHQAPPGVCGWSRRGDVGSSPTWDSGETYSRSFDRAEATFPYPFKTPTQDLVVVKQAKAVYDSVSGLINVQ
jgi:hypothetical protein